MVDGTGARGKRAGDDRKGSSADVQAEAAGTRGITIELNCAALFAASDFDAAGYIAVFADKKYFHFFHFSSCFLYPMDIICKHEDEARGRVRKNLKRENGNEIHSRDRIRTFCKLHP